MKLQKKKNKEKEERILNAGSEVFAREEFYRARMDKIANLSHLGKGTLYRYFKDKKGLFLAILDRKMVNLRTQVKETIARETDLFKKIKSAITIHLSFFEKNKGFLETIFHQQGKFQNYYFEHYNSLKGLEKPLQEGMKKNLIKRIKVENLSRLLTGLVHSSVHFYQNRSFGKRVALISTLFFAEILKK